MTDEMIKAEFEKPLTKEQMNEINKAFTHYIFYQREDRTPTAGYVGFCTYCRRHFSVVYSEICTDGHTLKHRDYAKCPLCGFTGTLFHSNRGKKTLTECRRVVVFRKTDKNHVFAQGFYAYKAYNGDPLEKSLNHLFDPDEWQADPPIELSESSRYYFTLGDVRMWKMQYDCYFHECIAWFEAKNPIKEPFGSGFGFRRVGYYFCNEKILKDTFLKYSCYEMYERSKSSAGQVMKYLAFYTLNPVCEMLLKFGLSDFVLEAVDLKKLHKRYINWNGTKPTEIFKRSTKVEFNEMFKCGISAEEYIRYVGLKRAGVKLTVSECCRISREYTYETDKYFDILKVYGISATKAENYLAKFEGKSRSRKAVFGIWKDYLDLAAKLGYDLADRQVYMPKKLIQAHDTAVSTFNTMKNEIEEKQMQKLTARLEKQFAFEYGDMMIVVPHSMQEIIDEGKALSHCVGGYAERHANGQTIILFLRKTSDPKTPYFTIEIDRKFGSKKPYIRQCHGYKNEVYSKKPQEVKEFETEFSKYIADPKGYINKCRRKTA